MKVFFRRTMQRSYMVIESELYLGYDMSLISRCRIDGFFPVQTVVGNGKLQFCYEISGLQMLDLYLEEKQIDADWLKQLILEIENVLIMAEKYLLVEDSIMLSMDKIGICTETGKLYFCYLPGCVVDMKEQFQKLMGELIKKVNHTDQHAVDITYAIYQMTLQENYSFEKIKQVFLNEKSEDRQVILQEGRQKDYEKVEEKYVLEKHIREESGQKKEINLKEIAGKKIQQLFEKKARKETEELQVAFEPDEEEEIVVSNPTVLLSSFDKTIGKLNYNGRHGEQDVLISKSSFILGTKENNVDGILHSKAVSRLHAKIRKVGTDYFLEDLNSKNGTWLNGELLNYKASYPLKKNDKICFADEEYIFS